MLVAAAAVHRGRDLCDAALSFFRAAEIGTAFNFALFAASLAHARTQQNTAGFEYGWVRGVGSAAFVAGTLAAGQAADHYGFSAIMWLSATALLAFPLAATFVPQFPARPTDDARHNEHPAHPWLMLLRQRVFGLVTLVGALIIGSHAMYDSAVIRWPEAGIRPATIALLWSESVAAEVVLSVDRPAALAWVDFVVCSAGA